jgi:predicted AlkP superfamily phosphohydrolase/phosphomutase
MDAITMLGAVAAAAQLAGMTSNLGLQLYRLYCDLKNAPKKSKELCVEISELSSVIDDLAHALKKAEGDSGIDVINMISMDSLQKYSQFLKELSSRLLVNKNIKEKLKWRLSTKDNEELIGKIERHKATFALALQSANLKLGSTHTYFS